jgi:acyl-CoA synthetase (AMP-forming)/AMP-acid ligase II
MGLIACLLLPLMTGTELVFMDNFSWALNPSMLLEAATHHRSTLCWLPNFAFNFLASRVPDAQKEPLRLDSVRMWINCSEPVRRESFEKFADAFADRGVRRGALASCYAMAENTFAVTQSTPGSPPPVTPSGDLTSSGVPLADHNLRILDEGGRELAEGELGEIHVQSPCLMDGYYRDDRRSTEVLRAGWYATGDLGMLMEGELYVSGRKKDLIILAGKNVFPEDVEQIAGEVEGVAPGRTVAFGIYADEEGTEELILLAEHRRDLDPTQAQHRQIQRAIKKEIADRLGLRAQRALLLSPRTLLKSTAGKISRSRCKTLYLEQLQADTQNPR